MKTRNFTKKLLTMILAFSVAVLPTISYAAGSVEEENSDIETFSETIEMLSADEEANEPAHEEIPAPEAVEPETTAPEVVEEPVVEEPVVTEPEETTAAVEVETQTQEKSQSSMGSFHVKQDVEENTQKEQEKENTTVSKESTDEQTVQSETKETTEQKTEAFVKEEASSSESNSSSSESQSSSGSDAKASDNGDSAVGEEEANTKSESQSSSGSVTEKSEPAVKQEVIQQIEQEEQSSLQSDVKSNSSADLENSSVWEGTLPGLTGDWADDIIAIAKSQLGYHESTSNYMVSATGVHQGYTRYGAWYGYPYGDWCAMFASFCLHYAGVPTSVVPENSSCYAWTLALKNLGLYENVSSDYTPKKGDLIFFNYDPSNGKSVDHVGFVESYSDGVITAIEGNHADMVAEATYSRNDSKVVGFGVLPITDDGEWFDMGDRSMAIYSEDDNSLTFYYGSYVGEDIYDGKTVTEIYLDFDTENFESAFDTPWYTDASLTEAVVIDESFAEVHPVSMNYWFYGFKNAEFTGLENLNMTESTGLAYTFYDCDTLQTLDVSVWDTGNVTDMSGLFYGCENLETIYSDDKLFNTESVEDSDGMFFGCESLIGGDGTEYDEEMVDAAMANIDSEADEGYFTGLLLIWENEDGKMSEPVSITRYFQGKEIHFLNSNPIYVNNEDAFSFDDSNELLYVDGYQIDHAELVFEDEIIDIANFTGIDAGDNEWSYYYQIQHDGMFMIDDDLNLIEAAPTYEMFHVDSVSELSIHLYYVTTKSAKMSSDNLIITAEETDGMTALQASYLPENNTDAFGEEYYFQWYRLNDDASWSEILGQKQRTLYLYSGVEADAYRVCLFRTCDQKQVAMSDVFDVDKTEPDTDLFDETVKQIVNSDRL